MDISHSPTHTLWRPDSWRQYPIKQQPQYPDEVELARVLERLSGFPPLVFAGEVDTLRQQLAEAENGQRFLLQGGDCAERFVDCDPELITNKLKILLKMSLVLSYGAKKPVIRLGRIAGQYAKPRSDEFETINGQQIPVFRGDCINSFEPDPSKRQADPQRLLEAYHRAALTLNYIRALVSGGFADLKRPENWDLRFFQNTPHHQSYEALIEQIRDAVSFLEAVGGTSHAVTGKVEFFTSHEALLLGFEQAMTHRTAAERFYNLGAHMLWIGDRTRQLTGAHVEYCRGIENPVGLKVGPSSQPQDVVDLVRRLNPSNGQGKVILITRYGVGAVNQHLPDVIKSVQDAGLHVLWSSDPMHGNMIKTERNVKTRDFAAIIGELEQCFAIHEALGSRLGGVHFELTGHDVTECIGGAGGISVQDLHKNYETYCDPRLNYGQSLEMAFRIASILKQQQTSGS